MENRQQHTSFEHSLPANEISEFYLAEASRHCGFSIEHAPTILLFFPIVLLASEQSAAKEITPHSSTLPSEPRNPVSCLVPVLAAPHRHSLVLITSPLFPLLRLFVPHNWRNYEYCLPVSISLPGLWWTDDSVLFRCTLLHSARLFFLVFECYLTVSCQPRTDISSFSRTSVVLWWRKHSLCGPYIILSCITVAWGQKPPTNSHQYSWWEVRLFRVWHGQALVYSDIQC